MADAKDADTPFFVWFNTTHMHFRTHVKDGSRGQAGRWQSEYHDTMIDHDDAGRRRCSTFLDEHGPGRGHDRHLQHRQRAAHEHLARRRDDPVPQREELELGGRLPGAGHGPLAGPDPGRPGAATASSATTTGSSPCWPRPPATPTSPTGSRRAPTWTAPPTRCTSTATTSSDYLTGEVDQSPRQHFFYVSDDGDLTAMRFDNWKIVFLEQRATGTLQVWAEPYTELRVPKIFNLRTDPYERADLTSNTYFDWLLDHAWVLVPAQAYVGRMLATLVEFPPRQEPASFTIDEVMEKLQAGVPSA